MAKIVIGKHSGRNVSVDLKVLLKTRALIQAGSGAGKSYFLRRLAEQLFGKVQTFIIDREGEFATLREKYGFVLAGDGGDTPTDLRSARLLAEKLLELRASAVCDLYEAFRTKPGNRRAWVRGFLEGIMDAPKKYWGRDLVVIVDEAHLFCPQESPKAASMIEREIIAGCKDAMVSLATAGRKRGYCAIWATQRLAKLDKDASAELLNRFVGQTIEDVDVDRAADLMSVSRDEKASFKKSIKNLEPGNFFGFGRAVSKDRILIRVGPVKTTHPDSGSSKYSAAAPPAPEKIRNLLPKLKDLPQEVETKAKNEAQLRKEILTLKGDLVRERKKKPAAAAPPPAPAKVETKTVEREIPVITPKDTKRVNDVLVRMERLYAKVMEPMTSLESELRSTVKGLGGKLSDAVEAMENLTAARKKGLAPPANRVTMKPDAPRRGVPPRSPLTVAKDPIPIPVNGDAQVLSRPQVRILSALAEFRAIGIEVVPRTWLAAWQSLKVTGSFKNNLGALRTACLIEYQGDMVQLTEQGIALAEPAEAMTDRSIIEHCERAVTRPQALLLRKLHSVHPDWVSREDLSEGLGLRISGSFKNNLGALRTGGLIEYGTGQYKNHVKCADWLFAESRSVA